MERYFALIRQEDGKLHASAGIQGEIEINDWFMDLAPELKEKAVNFMNTAELANALTVDDVTILRIEGSEENLFCDCCF